MFSGLRLEVRQYKEFVIATSDGWYGAHGLIAQDAVINAPLVVIIVIILTIQLTAAARVINTSAFLFLFSIAYVFGVPKL